MWHIIPSQVVVLAVSALACFFDIRTRRIPNILTFGTAALALLFHATASGFGGFTTSVGGWLTGVALFVPFFLLGGMGAGDVKLLGAIGAWLGPAPTVWVALYSAIIGSIMAIVLASARGYLTQALRNVWTLLAYWRVMGIRPFSTLTLERGTGPRLAYALPIAAGACLTIWLDR